MKLMVLHCEWLNFVWINKDPQTINILHHRPRTKAACLMVEFSPNRFLNHHPEPSETNLSNIWLALSENRLNNRLNPNQPNGFADHYLYLFMAISLGKSIPHISLRWWGDQTSEMENSLSLVTLVPVGWLNSTGWIYNMFIICLYNYYNISYMAKDCHVQSSEHRICDA